MIGFTRSQEVLDARYEMLKDCISDYLGDDGEKAEDLTKDIKRACIELKTYHGDRLAQFNIVEDSFDD